MAITTDSTYTVSSGGISYDIIGYSKTLDNYSTDEILAYTYCSADNTGMKHIQKREQIAYFTMVENTGVAVPWNMTRVSSTNISINAGDPTKENYGQLGVYCGIIWLARTTNGNDLCITTNNRSSYKIVTKFAAKNYCYELSAPSTVANNYGQNGWSGTQLTPTFPIWYLGGGSLYYYITADGATKIDLSSQRIRPYAMFKHDGKVFFVQFSDNSSIFRYIALNTLNEGTDPNYYPWIASNGISSYDGTGYAITAAALENYPTSSPFPKNYNKNSLGQYGSSYRHFASDEGICLIGQFGGTIHTPPLYDAGSETFIYFNSKDSVLDFWKGIGIKFKGDKVYKPIIVDGYVTGYSDDLTVESDLDNYIGDSNHTVPGSRPTPTPPGPGYDDDPWNNIGASLYSGNAGAFTNVIGLSTTECENLAAHLNSINMPIGYDPMPSIIGLKFFPFALTGAGTETTVQFQIGPGRIDDPAYTGGGVWDTTVPCKVYSSTTEVFDLGSVTIPERMSERGYPFADYQTSFEAYIPFIGSMPLNTEFIVGKTLHAYLYVDYVSGGCTGVIFAYVGNSPIAAGMPIAYGSGTCAVDIPIASNGGGLQTANLIAGSVKSVFALGTAITNYQTGNIMGSITSSWESATRATRTALALNNNLTTCLGMSGDQSGFYLPNKAFIKVVRPRVARDNNYQHSHAYPVCITGTLSGQGLCIVNNPDLSFISTATDTEKMEMYNMLTTGVYTG